MLHARFARLEARTRPQPSLASCASQGVQGPSCPAHHRAATATASATPAARHLRCGRLTQAPLYWHNGKRMPATHAHAHCAATTSGQSRTGAPHAALPAVGQLHVPRLRRHAQHSLSCWHPPPSLRWPRPRRAAARGPRKSCTAPCRLRRRGSAWPAPPCRGPGWCPCSLQGP